MWCVTSCVLTYSALDLEDDVLDVVKNEVLEILDVEDLKDEDEVIGPRPRHRGPRCRGRCPRCPGDPRHLERRP